MTLVVKLFLAVLVYANAFVPTPSSRKLQLKTQCCVVGSDKFDMDELRERILHESNPYQSLFKSKEWETRPKPEKVSIVFFQPDTPQEGIHTIEFPKGSSSNIVLAFESMKDCGTFAASLSSQGFYDPSPREVDLTSLESYCLQIGVFVQVVPRGMKIRPPTQNVKHFGQNPQLRDQKRQLDYLLQMSDVELEEPGALESSDFLGAWD